MKLSSETMTSSYKSSVFSTNNISLKSLSDLFDFHPNPPCAGCIVSGLDTLNPVRTEFTSETVFTFSRHDNSMHSNVTLSWKPEDDEDGTLQTFELAIDCPAEFVLLPYDPVTGESHQLSYRSVRDAARCFPPFVRVQTVDAEAAVGPGDLLKLLSLVQDQDGADYVQCRLVDDTKRINLPFDCTGQFAAVFDRHVTYTVADLVCGHVMPARRRRVVPVSHTDIADNLPADAALMVELPWQWVEARPVKDPMTVIRLPLRDENILVRPVTTEADGGQSLANLVEYYHGMFPLAVQVSHCKEETTIMENHFIRPGVQLTLHGITRINKVLAVSSGRYYAIPMNYRGLFQRRPRIFSGGTQLQQAADKCRCRDLVVRVIYMNRQEKLSVELGDKLRINSISSESVTCEKLSASESLSQDKEQIKIPVRSNASFEEVLNIHVFDNESPCAIDKLAQAIQTSGGMEMRVELVEQSADKSRSSHNDLPIDTDILLTHVFVDMSVYASVDNLLCPVFHIPLRTPMLVSFLSQLDKRASPLLNATRMRTSSPLRVSTLERCAELLSADTVSVLRRTGLNVYQPSRVQNTATVENNITSKDEALPKESIQNNNKRSDVDFKRKTKKTIPIEEMSEAVPLEKTTVQQKGVNFASDVSKDDEDLAPIAVSAKAGNFKLRIPDDGNLYHLSAKKFTILLECLKLDHQVVESCRKQRFDGKMFSRLSENEMEMTGLMNPVLLHFRRLTVKQT